MVVGIITAMVTAISFGITFYSAEQGNVNQAKAEIYSRAVEPFLTNKYKQIGEMNFKRGMYTDDPFFANQNPQLRAAKIKEWRDTLSGAIENEYKTGEQTAQALVDDAQVSDPLFGGLIGFFQGLFS